ncbi:MAG: calcium-binding protein [Cyanobacteria bacterium J06633_2]
MELPDIASLTTDDPLLLDTHHLAVRPSPLLARESDETLQSFPIGLAQLESDGPSAPRRYGTPLEPSRQLLGQRSIQSIGYSETNPRDAIADTLSTLGLSIGNGDELISPGQDVDVSQLADSVSGDRRTRRRGKTALNRIRVNGRKQRVVGTAKADRIDASVGQGQNQLLGKGGNDRLFVHRRDTAKGAGGRDYLSAENGKAHNQLRGGGGADTLVARKRDRLWGNGGNDVLDARSSIARNQLNGGRGNDVLYAGQRRDNLTGGPGADQFWLATQTLPTQPHIVRDFEPGVDQVRFDRVDGLTEVDELTLTETATGTTIHFQGTAIAVLENVTPQQLEQDSVDVIPKPPVSPPKRQLDTEIFATYRKDFFFPNEVYDEDTPEPLTGGRVQIAAIAQSTGRVNDVVIDGIERRVIYEKNPNQTPPFEWVHVWPPRARKGEPIWVNFHSNDPKWDQLTQASIRVETRNGSAIDGTFAIQQTPVPLTYVTTTDDYSQLLIHAQNTDAVGHTIKHLWVNGTDVLASPSAHVSPIQQTIAPDSHALWEIALPAPTAPGEAWTVVVEYDNAPAAVGTGRVVPEFFPIMAWNNTSERPFPSGNTENYLNVREAGIDTIFVNNGTCRNQACDPYQLINEELANTEGFGAFINYSPFVDPASNVPDFTDTSGIVAVMTGDESDDTLYDDDTGVPIPALKALDSRRSWLRYPELPTFNGGKTNKLIGSFAGMTDIQGIDFYTAAGAPHITAFGEHPPLRATFDYLRNTRNNHMPLTTWMYTQGLSPAWNRDPIFGGDKISFQPDPQEILVQGMMAIAAGAKGLAWFQINQNEAKKAPERWEAIADLNSMVRAVRPWLREGDVTGQANSDEDTLVELIQAPDALVIPIVSLDTKTEPTDIGFILAQSEDAIPRWTFDESAPDISVTIPPGFNVADAFEVQPEGVSDIPVTLSGQTALFEDVELDNEQPVRLLVLAENADARDEVMALL